MLALGRAYSTGVGVLRDLIEAYKWFNLAAGLGVLEALDERSKLESVMTASERSEADRLSRQWEQTRAQAVVSSAAGEDDSSVRVPDDALTSRQSVREAQSLLSTLGYSPGPADGIWGPKTATAYHLFLADRKFPVVNALTQSNLLKMRKAVDPQAASVPQNTALEPISLYQAATAGKAEVIDSAIRSGTDINRLDRRGWSALMYAVDIGNEQAVTMLIANGADPTVQSPDGTTALSLARKRGHREVTELLYGSKRARSSDSAPASNSSQSADSTSTTQSGSTQDFLMGLLSILEENSPNTASRNEETAFSNLLGRYPSTDAVDENGWTDMHWAAVMDLPDVAVRLANAGADVNAATHRDGRRFSPRLTSNLSIANADFAWDSWQRDGVTPLHVAAYTDSHNTAKALVDKGAYVDAQNSRGETPLHYAIWGKSIVISRSLLSKDAHVNIRSETGITPLHLAAYRNFPDGVSLLISHNARIEARERNNMTPLHIAVREGSVDAARILLNNGADAYAFDQRGMTPINLAIQSRNAEMLELFRVY